MINTCLIYNFLVFWKHLVVLFDMHFARTIPRRFYCRIIPTEFWIDFVITYRLLVGRLLCAHLVHFLRRGQLAGLLHIGDFGI